VIGKLNAEIVKVIRTPAVVAYLAKEGAVPKGSSPAELTAMMQADLAKWDRVIRTARIRFD
jgi:tripartite-type tricarboxylate transporter receptor subunit TctC